MSGKLQVVKSVNILLRMNLGMTFSRTITGLDAWAWQRLTEIAREAKEGGRQNGGVEETAVRRGPGGGVQ